MSERRLIGIWFVAAFFFARAMFYSVTVAIAIVSPSDASRPLATIRAMIPLVRRLDAGPNLSLIIASLFVVFDIVVGVCVLTRQKWAAGYIVAFNGIALLWYLAVSLGLKVMGIDSSSEILSSPYGKAEILASLLMVVYLIQPKVRRSFGFS